MPPPSLARTTIGFAWGPDQYDFGHGFSSDGSQSAIVRKLVLISVRGNLGLLAASAEWLTFRLTGPDDPASAALVATLWAGATDPRQADPTFAGQKTDPIKGPILEYARTVRSCYRTALAFDGAFFSHAESALRLVDYVMPNGAYRTWRRDRYGSLAALTSSHAMRAVRASLGETGVERRLTAGDVDALWGPALPREAYEPI
ncbi:hypothetical protein [Actinoplanes sp. NPDC051851]|uniref:hypothetical protein n=1 Tax=Actinoplanes sp. NPDC051851 TaxID=3154753 RepID=UPI0034410771